MLQLYRQPGWNNPVVRIVDEQGRELARRSRASWSCLARTDYRYGPVTERRQILAKRPAYLGEDPAQYLSPRPRFA